MAGVKRLCISLHVRDLSPSSPAEQLQSPPMVGTCTIFAPHVTWWWRIPSRREKSRRRAVVVSCSSSRGHNSLCEGPSCIFVGPLESASKEVLEALYRQVLFLSRVRVPPFCCFPLCDDSPSFLIVQGLSVLFNGFLNSHSGSVWMRRKCHVGESMVWKMSILCLVGDSNGEISMWEFFFHFVVLAEQMLNKVICI